MTTASTMLLPSVTTVCGLCSWPLSAATTATPAHAPKPAARKSYLCCGGGGWWWREENENVSRRRFVYRRASKLSEMAREARARVTELLGDRAAIGKESERGVCAGGVGGVRGGRGLGGNR